ncbi:hypothetical protein FOA43_001795 [Brettanomyces nanus]|uniref:SET domain-containing protein n=1 Tax=Eeniella nana TaxID=13502 RepID=A0A875S2B1_EENNA|nr:uncharacterized protein FOA43_001795 [Brettanomyces nanus]QPG74465.1 hypothetical protein FOA43_001795 [Brettanomyces nanus]
MSLIKSNIKGVDDSNYWVKSQVGAKFHDNLTVEKSSLGGLGLFYDGNEIDQDTEILRISSDCTLSIHQCMKIMNSGVDDKGTFAKTFIQKCLDFYCNGKVTESRILICYCISMEVLNRIEKLDSLKGTGFVRNYLKILLNTRVSNVDCDSLSLLEYYKEEFKGNSLFDSVYKQLINGDCEEFAKFIEVEALENVYGEVISAEEIQHLVTAIRSRILEIPRETESEGDFTIDITLVPILDFANHDNDKVNAYFDVDRVNGDIILKLDKDKIKGSKGKHEVLISYSRIEDMNRFFLNYGFIPRSKGIKLIEIPFWGYYKDKEIPLNVTEILYKLQETPNLQFVVKTDEEGDVQDVKINMLDDYSFLTMANVQWDKYFIEGEEEDEEEIVSTLMEKMSVDEINVAMFKMMKLVNKYIKEYPSKLKNFLAIADEYELNLGETRNIVEMIKFEEQIAEKFNAIYEKKKPQDAKDAFDMIVPPDECDENWTKVRMYPIYNFEQELLDQQIKIEQMTL